MTIVMVIHSVFKVAFYIASPAVNRKLIKW